MCVHYCVHYRVLCKPFVGRRGSLLDRLALVGPSLGLNKRPASGALPIREPIDIMIYDVQERVATIESTYLVLRTLQYSIYNILSRVDGKTSVPGKNSGVY